MEVLAAYAGDCSVIEMVIEKKVGGCFVLPGLLTILMANVHCSLEPKACTKSNPQSLQHLPRWGSSAVASTGG